MQCIENKWSLALFVFSLGILLFIMNACNNSSTCIEPQTVALRGGFYYLDTANKFIDSPLVNANIRFGPTMNYFQNLKGTSKFRFPLSQIEDSVHLVFQSDSLSVAPQTVDSIYIYYQRELHFISTACGYENFYTITQIKSTKNLIDTLLITTAKITNDITKEHFKIGLKK